MTYYITKARHFVRGCSSSTEYDTLDIFGFDKQFVVE